MWVGLEHEILDYLPTVEELRTYDRPGPHELKVRNDVRGGLQNSSYILTQSDADPDKFVIVPQWHSLNLQAPQSPGLTYGQNAFEGISLERGLVLFPQRMERFRSSVAALHVENLTDGRFEAFKAGLMVLAAISVGDRHDALGKSARLYMRPLGERVGKPGVTPKKGDQIRLSGMMWRWPFYLPERVYSEGARVMTTWGAQRLGRLHGKLATNYPSYDYGPMMERVGVDEMLFWGPYIFRDGKREYVNSEEGETAWARMENWGVIVDGIGEDLIYFKGNKEASIQPMDTGILGGKTREYMSKHLLPSLGFEVREEVVTINDIREGLITGMAMVGNAVKFAPIKSLIKTGIDSKVLENLEIGVSEEVWEVQTVFAAELSGARSPVGPLLTPVDVSGGIKARAVLDEVYSAWL